MFWKPVFNLLEGQVETWLVNAQHIKKVPGRKTDVKDAEWIAQLLQCGLIRPSCVPARAAREVRDSGAAPDQIGAAAQRGGQPGAQGPGG